MPIKSLVAFLFGIRREEGGRLGGAAGGNLKDRAFTTSLGERHGFDAVFPIAYMSEIQRDTYHTYL
jgi:hypothetical protein